MAGTPDCDRGARGSRGINCNDGSESVTRSGDGGPPNGAPEAASVPVDPAQLDSAGASLGECGTKCAPPAPAAPAQHYELGGDAGSLYETTKRTRRHPRIRRRPPP